MRKSQSLIDYGIIIGIVGIVLASMSGYLQRSLQAKTKDLTDFFVTSKQRVSVNKRVFYPSSNGATEALIPEGIARMESTQVARSLEKEGVNTQTITVNTKTESLNLMPQEDPDKDINTVELLANIKTSQEIRRGQNAKFQIYSKMRDAYEGYRTPRESN